MHAGCAQGPQDLPTAWLGHVEPASRTSTDDISSGRRGGLRSHTGAKGRTYEQLYAEARHRNVAGRSKMNKAELERTLAR